MQSRRGGDGEASILPYTDRKEATRTQQLESDAPLL